MLANNAMPVVVGASLAREQRCASGRGGGEQGHEPAPTTKPMARKCGKRRTTSTWAKTTPAR